MDTDGSVPRAEPRFDLGDAAGCGACSPRRARWWPSSAHAAAPLDPARSERAQLARRRAAGDRSICGIRFRSRPCRGHRGRAAAMIAQQVAGARDALFLMNFDVTLLPAVMRPRGDLSSRRSGSKTILNRSPETGAATRRAAPSPRWPPGRFLRVCPAGAPWRPPGARGGQIPRSGPTSTRDSIPTPASARSDGSRARERSAACWEGCWPGAPHR